jgi:adenylate cyclase
VFDHIKGKVKLDFADLGPQKIKNIAEPIRVYQLLSDAPAEPAGLPTSAELPLSDKPSIAILPFANKSGDIDQEYLSDGFTEDIITALTRYRSLRVIARNSSFSYKEGPSDVRLISQDLKVRYVVEGSVRSAGERIRVSVQLIDAEARHHIWAERYDRELQDIFAVQDEIAQTITAALIPEIDQAEQERAHRKPPQNLSAWEYYQRGLRHMYRFALDDLVEAKQLFEGAIQRDQDFAAAYSGLAYALLQEVMYSEPEHPNELLIQALDVARKGVVLDDHDAFAHFVLGRVHIMHREFEIACVEFEKAIQPEFPR